MKEDYSVKVTVRNGRILKRMREKGYASQAAFARAAGISTAAVNEIVAMRRSPIRADGDWRESVSRIAGVLQCDPEDLFTEKQRTLALPRNTSEKYMSEPEVRELASGGSGEKRVWDKLEVERLLEQLPTQTDSTGQPRSHSLREVVERRFFRNQTLEEVGEALGVTPTRVRQLEWTALRKMRTLGMEQEEKGRGKLIRSTTKKEWERAWERAADAVALDNTLLRLERDADPTDYRALWDAEELAKLEERRKAGTLPPWMEDEYAD